MLHDLPLRAVIPFVAPSLALADTVAVNLGSEKCIPFKLRNTDSAGRTHPGQVRVTPSCAGGSGKWAVE